MSQSAMELLRLETELDFWPSLLNSHRHSVTPSNCHHSATPPSSPTSSASPSSAATSPTSNNASSVTPAMTNHFHHHHHGHHTDEKSPKSNEKKSVAGYSRTPHSYCKSTSRPCLVASDLRLNSGANNGCYSPLMDYTTMTQQCVRPSK